MNDRRRNKTSPNNLNNGLDWVLGLSVRVTTALDDQIVGSVYSYCPSTNTLVVEEDAKAFRIVKASFIKDIAVLRSKQDASTPTASVNLSSVGQKLNRALKAAGQIAATRGVGVTPQAQDLCDAIAKTLPVRWLNKTILVLEEVRIEPPYTVESCHAADPDSVALARVRKVVDGERRRLNLSTDERKGG